jgi:NADH dehydrogenase
VDYTILRSAIVFGPNDQLTTGLTELLRRVPFLFLMPGSGDVLLQPFWVEDLVTCLTWALEDDETRNRMFEVGGPEYIPFNMLVETVMQAAGVRRKLVSVAPPYLRGLTVTLESYVRNLPVSVYWLDYLAANRTCALDTVPRIFNLMPARFSQRLAYLKAPEWQRKKRRSLIRRGA